MSDYSENINMYRTTAGFIRRIFMVAQGRNSLGASLCLGEMEMISKLVQCKYEWGPRQKDYTDSGRTNYSKYIMHTLLFALRPMDAGAIVDKMSQDNKEMLKQAVLAAQLSPKPKLSDVREEIEHCVKKIRKGEFNIKTNEKDVIHCMRNIAECAEFVADENIWNIAQEEMHKWSDILGVPYDDAMIEKNDPIKRKKKGIEHQKTPVQEPVVIPEVIKVESKQEPKQSRGRGRPKGSKNRPKPQADAKSVVESPIPGQKLRKISETRSEAGRTKQSSVLIKENGEEWWSIGKLATELGLADEATFSRKKANFLYRYPKHKRTMQKWFERQGTYVYFKSEYLEQLKDLLGPTTRKPRTKKVEKESVAENPVEMSAPVVQNETPPAAAMEPVIQETPGDMLAVKGTDVYLTKLQELYEAANAEQEKQRGLSEEYAAKAQTAKTNKEQAAQDAKEIQASMEEYKRIQGDLALAEEGLRVAERRVKEQQDKLAKWKDQNKKYLGK